MNAGRLDEAETLAGEAVARHPDRAESHIRWAEVAMRREDWTRACERWAALRRAFPDHAAGYFRGALALMNAGRLDEAETLAGEAVARFPDRTESHIRWAEAAMRREDWTRACERWEEFRRTFPDHAAGYFRGAKALMNAGCPEEAEALAHQVKERFPERFRDFVELSEPATRPGDRASRQALTNAKHGI